MKRSVSLICLLALAATAVAMAATADPPAMTATRPATQPATTQAADPSAAQPAVSPEVERILDRMEAAGRKIRTLTAEVRYTEEELLFAERTTYTGRVWYAQDPADQDPPRFRIRFDAIRSGRNRRQADRDYVFTSDANGQWLLSRNGEIKQIVKYHIAPAGGRTNPLELGQGPFPVPFGQRKDRVLALFEVTTRPTTAGDGEGTTFLRLVPRAAGANSLRVRWIEIWVNDDGLPVRIRTEDTQGETRKTAAFSAMRINPTFDASVFDLPWPSAGSGWERRVEPLPQQNPGGRTGL